jgi:hypothetical protein
MGVSYYAVLEAHNPHRAMIYKGIASAEGGWTERFGFYAYDEPVHGTQLYTVREAFNPHRCMVDEGHAARNNGEWKERLSFYAHNTPMSASASLGTLVSVGEASKPHRAMLAGEKHMTFSGWSERLSFYSIGVLYPPSADQVKYALAFEAGAHSALVRRAEGLTPADNSTKHFITHLIALWDIDELRMNIPRGRLFEGQRDRNFTEWVNGARNRNYRAYLPSARIDNQLEGMTYINNTAYYNIQVQIGSQSYAQASVPAGYPVGRRRIRNELVESMNYTRNVVIAPAGALPAIGTSAASAITWVLIHVGAAVAGYMATT